MLHCVFKADLSIWNCQMSGLFLKLWKHGWMIDVVKQWQWGTGVGTWWLRKAAVFVMNLKATGQICHLTCVLKDTYSPAQRPLSSTGSLLTLCCSAGVKYWLSPPFRGTPVDLVTLCHLLPRYITAAITSVLCFTMPHVLSEVILLRATGKRSEKLRAREPLKTVNDNIWS